MKTHPKRRSVCALAALASCALQSQGGIEGPIYTNVTEQANIYTEFIPLDDGTYANRNELTSGGVSVGDFNADGWLDMYVPAGGTGPEQLLINMGDGTFDEQASLWGVDRFISAMGSAVGDINKDGYQDLYVVSHGDPINGPQPGQCLLYLNMGPDDKGQFRFEEIGEQAGVNFILPDIVEGTGATFGDVDLDGHMDLVVTCWALQEFGTRMFINNGDNTFRDISYDALPDTGPMRAFTPKLIDLNGDRFPELLLTNDFHESRLYVSNGKNELGEITYRDVTDISGITDDCNGMGATVSDFNADGLLDWYMTNIYLENDPPCGNTLFMCTGIDETGMPSFVNTAQQVGVIDGGWGWGTTSGDYDNDGDNDISAINGYSQWLLEDIRMYLNDGSADFVDGAADAGLDFKIKGHGMAHLDYDNDGDLDLVFIQASGPTLLYRNDSTNGNNWIRLNLITRNNPCLAPMGTGTRVTAYAGDTAQVQVLSSPNTYLSTNEMIVHFGFDDLETIDRIELEWADGRMSTLMDVATNQILDVEVFHPADIYRNGELDIFDVFEMLGAYVDQDPAADIDGNGSIDPSDITAFVNEFSSGCN